MMLSINYGIELLKFSKLGRTAINIYSYILLHFVTVVHLKLFRKAYIGLASDFRLNG